MKYLGVVLSSIVTWADKRVTAKDNQRLRLLHKLSSCYRRMQGFSIVTLCGETRKMPFSKTTGRCCKIRWLTLFKVDFSLSCKGRGRFFHSCYVYKCIHGIASHSMDREIAVFTAPISLFSMALNLPEAFLP